MTLYCFRIRSAVFDVHGIQLREYLRAALYLHSQKPGKSVKGIIQNNRNPQSVDVKLVYSEEGISKEIEDVLWKAILENSIVRYMNATLDANMPPNFLSSEKEDEKRKRWRERFTIDLQKSSDTPLERYILSLNSVEIERQRGDEEAAWALQGAGKVFQSVSKQIRERDELKIRNRIAGLYVELIRNQQKLHEILREQDKHFILNALNGFLVELPFGLNSEEKKTLVRSLQAVFVDLDYLNDLPSKAEKYQDTAIRKVEVKKLSEQIDKVLTPLEVQYNLYGGNAKDLLIHESGAGQPTN